MKDRLKLLSSVSNVAGALEARAFTYLIFEFLSSETHDQGKDSEYEWRFSLWRDSSWRLSRDILTSAINLHGESRLYAFSLSESINSVDCIHIYFDFIHRKSGVPVASGSSEANLSELSKIQSKSIKTSLETNDLIQNLFPSLPPPQINILFNISIQSFRKRLPIGRIPCNSLLPDKNGFLPLYPLLDREIELIPGFLDSEYQCLQLFNKLNSLSIVSGEGYNLGRKGPEDFLSFFVSVENVSLTQELMDLYNDREILVTSHFFSSELSENTYDSCNPVTRKSYLGSLRNEQGFWIEKSELYGFADEISLSSYQSTENMEENKHDLIITIVFEVIVIQSIQPTKTENETEKKNENENRRKSPLSRTVPTFFSRNQNKTPMKLAATSPHINSSQKKVSSTLKNTSSESNPEGSVKKEILCRGKLNLPIHELNTINRLNLGDSSENLQNNPFSLFLFPCSETRGNETLPVGQLSLNLSVCDAGEFDVSTNQAKIALEREIDQFFNESLGEDGQWQDSDIPCLATTLHYFTSCCENLLFLEEENEEKDLLEFSIGRNEGLNTNLTSDLSNQLVLRGKLLDDLASLLSMLAEPSGLYVETTVFKEIVQFLEFVKFPQEHAKASSLCTVDHGVQKALESFFQEWITGDLPQVLMKPPKTSLKTHKTSLKLKDSSSIENILSEIDDFLGFKGEERENRVMLKAAFYCVKLLFSFSLFQGEDNKTPKKRVTTNKKVFSGVEDEFNPTYVRELCFDLVKALLQYWLTFLDEYQFYLLNSLKLSNKDKTLVDGLKVGLLSKERDFLSFCAFCSNTVAILLSEVLNSYSETENTATRMEIETLFCDIILSFVKCLNLLQKPDFQELRDETLVDGLFDIDEMREKMLSEWVLTVVSFFQPTDVISPESDDESTKMDIPKGHFDLDKTHRNQSLSSLLQQLCFTLSSLQLTRSNLFCANISDALLTLQQTATTKLRYTTPVAPTSRRRSSHSSPLKPHSSLFSPTADRTSSLWSLSNADPEEGHAQFLFTHELLTPSTKIQSFAPMRVRRKKLNNLVQNALIPGEMTLEKEGFIAGEDKISLSPTYKRILPLNVPVKCFSEVEALLYMDVNKVLFDAAFSLALLLLETKSSQPFTSLLRCYEMSTPVSVIRHSERGVTDYGEWGAVVGSLLEVICIRVWNAIIPTNAYNLHITQIMGKIKDLTDDSATAGFLWFLLLNTRKTLLSPIQGSNLTQLFQTYYLTQQVLEHSLETSLLSPEVFRVYLSSIVDSFDDLDNSNQDVFSIYNFEKISFIFSEFFRKEDQSIGSEGSKETNAVVLWVQLRNSLLMGCFELVEKVFGVLFQQEGFNENDENLELLSNLSQLIDKVVFMKPLCYEREELIPILLDFGSSTTIMQQIFIFALTLPTNKNAQISDKIEKIRRSLVFTVLSYVELEYFEDFGKKPDEGGEISLIPSNIHSGFFNSLVQELLKLLFQPLTNRSLEMRIPLPSYSSSLKSDLIGDKQMSPKDRVRLSSALLKTIVSLLNSNSWDDVLEENQSVYKTLFIQWLKRLKDELQLHLTSVKIYVTSQRQLLILSDEDAKTQMKPISFHNFQVSQEAKFHEVFLLASMSHLVGFYYKTSTNPSITNIKTNKPQEINHAKTQQQLQLVQRFSEELLELTRSSASEGFNSSSLGSPQTLGDPVLSNLGSSHEGFLSLLHLLLSQRKNQGLPGKGDGVGRKSLKGAESVGFLKYSQTNEEQELSLLRKTISFFTASGDWEVGLLVAQHFLELQNSDNFISSETYNEEKNELSRTPSMESLRKSPNQLRKKLSFMDMGETSPIGSPRKKQNMKNLYFYGLPAASSRDLLQSSQMSFFEKNVSSSPQRKLSVKKELSRAAEKLREKIKNDGDMRLFPTFLGLRMISSRSWEEISKDSGFIDKLTDLQLKPSFMNSEKNMGKLHEFWFLIRVDGTSHKKFSQKLQNYLEEEIEKIEKEKTENDLNPAENVKKTHFPDINFIPPLSPLVLRNQLAIAFPDWSICNSHESIETYLNHWRTTKKDLKRPPNSSKTRLQLIQLFQLYPKKICSISSIEDSFNRCQKAIKQLFSVSEEETNNWLNNIDERKSVESEEESDNSQGFNDVEGVFKEYFNSVQYPGLPKNGLNKSSDEDNKGFKANSEGVKYFAFALISEEEKDRVKTENNKNESIENSVLNPTVVELDLNVSLNKRKSMGSKRKEIEEYWEKVTKVSDEEQNELNFVNCYELSLDVGCIDYFTGFCDVLEDDQKLIENFDNTFFSSQGLLLTGRLSPVQLMLHRESSQVSLVTAALATMQHTIIVLSRCFESLQHLQQLSTSELNNQPLGDVISSDTIFTGIFAQLYDVLVVPNASCVHLGNIESIIVAENERLELKWQSIRKKLKRKYMKEISDFEETLKNVKENVNSGKRIGTKPIEPDFEKIKEFFEKQDIYKDVQKLVFLRTYVWKLAVKIISEMRKFAEKITSQSEIDAMNMSIEELQQIVSSKKRRSSITSNVNHKNLFQKMSKESEKVGFPNSPLNVYNPSLEYDTPDTLRLKLCAFLEAQLSALEIGIAL